jgi:hypothetical protein
MVLGMKGEGRDALRDFSEVGFRGVEPFVLDAGDGVSGAIFWIRWDRRGVDDAESMGKYYNMYMQCICTAESTGQLRRWR